MLEALFEILFELLLQVVLEVLAEFGLQSIKATVQRQPNPWLAALGYLILGGVVGGLSLLVMPRHQVTTHLWQLMNLAVTPLLAGWLMSLIGAWRARRDLGLIRIDQFSYGYLFALALALIRYKFAA